jgi:hypothetical protein
MEERRGGKGRPTTQRELDDRRELVTKHMFDLMRSITDKYVSPDKWLDAIVGSLEPSEGKRTAK